jgi:hypothetical protein
MPQASDIDSVKRPGQTVVQPLAVVTRGPTEALLGRLPIDRPIGAVAEEKPRQGGHDLISSLAVASSMSCLPARPWCSSRPASCSPAEQDPTYRGSFSQRRHRRRHPSGHHSPRCPGRHWKTVERCRISHSSGGLLRGGQMGPTFQNRKDRRSRGHQLLRCGTDSLDSPRANHLVHRRRPANIASWLMQIPRSGGVGWSGSVTTGGRHYWPVSSSP